MSQSSSTTSTSVQPLPPPTSVSTSSTDASKDKPVYSVTTGGTVNLQSKKSIIQTVYALAFVMLTPVTLPFSVTNYFFIQAKNITLVIYYEMKKVAGLGFNAVELGVLLTKALSIITFRDGNTKPLMPRMMDVYNKMASTLIDFNALPCTKQSGALGHLMLSRLPKFIWEYMLPYPHPFFRGSVTQTIKTDSCKLLTSTETVPNDYYSPFVASGKKKTK